MTGPDDYAIRGGEQGRERLRILAGILQSSTASLFDRIGLHDGMTCLDVGCGGGDVTVELARRVGPSGTAVGVDLDETILDLARQESDAAGTSNVEFHSIDIRDDNLTAEFDLVYARFLLTHIRDPGAAMTALRRHVRPGGILVVEDIDFEGSFNWPESNAVTRYYELYVSVVRERGGDPNIGRRLPLLLADADLAGVEMRVVQPLGTQGEVKLMNPITLENIAESAVRDGHAKRAEIDSLLEQLYRYAADPRTLVALPRIVQAWGHRQVASASS